MKTLELNEMEKFNGGFSWKGCASQGLGLAVAYSGSLAVAIGGFWGFGAALIVGCVAGGLAMDSQKAMPVPLKQ